MEHDRADHTGRNESVPPLKGKSEYHCLGDVCILVNVPSASTIVSNLGEPPEQIDEAILEAYAKRVEAQRTDDETDDDIEDDYAKNDDSLTNALTFETHRHFVTTKSPDYKRSSLNQLKKNISTPDVNCADFLDHVIFAKEFVNNIVQISEEKLEKKSIPKQQTEKSENTIEEDSMFSFIDTKRTFSSWPTIENFNVEFGAYKIDEYLSSFETEEDWLYVIYYQGVKQSEYSDEYKYQAIYSLPTWRYPIAQATASIYFSINICKIVPQTCPVDVTYQYESFRRHHKPGVSDFQEKWLHYILDSKINFFKTITY